MLQDSVSAASVITDSRSGVMHLEFSVLHRSVDAVSAVAGLSGGRAGGGVSQWIGTQPAYAVFHLGQLKNQSFRNLFF